MHPASLPLSCLINSMHFSLNARTRYAGSAVRVCSSKCSRWGRTILHHFVYMCMCVGDHSPVSVLWRNSPSCITSYMFIYIYIYIYACLCVLATIRLSLLWHLSCVVFLRTWCHDHTLQYFSCAGEGRHATNDRNGNVKELRRELHIFSLIMTDQFMCIKL